MLVSILFYVAAGYFVDSDMFVCCVEIHGVNTLVISWHVDVLDLEVKNLQLP